METRNKRSAWKIWLAFTPLYILVAIPLVRWTMQINSGDVPLSKEDSRAFSAQDGEIKRSAAQQNAPELYDNGLSVRYHKKAPGGQDGGTGTEGGDKAPARSTGTASAQTAPGSDEAKAKEQLGMGQEKGFLTYAVGVAMNNPRAVSAIFNSSLVIKGFMGRDAVKSALGSRQGLANYCKGSGPRNFVNNSVVQSALKNPAIVSAVMSSGLVQSLMTTPAVKDLMNNPQAAADLFSSNPELVSLLLSNPALMSNPDFAAIASKFDIGALKQARY